MKAATYRVAWEDEFARFEPQYREILERDPLRDWAHNALPEVTAEGLLISGTKIAFAKPGAELARAAWLQCIQVHRRADQEDRWLAPACKDGFPKNRGRSSRAAAYAEAFLIGTLNMELLGRAAQDYEEWCSGYTLRETSGQAEANVLSAARLWILAERGEKARQTMRILREFRSHSDEFQILNGLLAPGHSPEPIRFDRYFDQVRSPSFRPAAYMEREVVRFELAAIRRQMLIGESPVKWSEVLADTAK